jgi:hypothetical protein
MFEQAFKNIDEILQKDADFDKSYRKRNGIKALSKSV